MLDTSLVEALIKEKKQFSNLIPTLRILVLFIIKFGDYF